MILCILAVYVIHSRGRRRRRSTCLVFLGGNGKSTLPSRFINK